MGSSQRAFEITTYDNRINTIITVPAGTVDGDVLLFAFVMGAAGTPALTPPAGLTLVSGPEDVVVSGFTVQRWFYYRTASSEPASYTFVHDSQSTEALCIAVQGGTGAPTVTSNSGIGLAATATGLTTTAASSYVGYICHNWELFGSALPPTGTTPTFSEESDSASNLLYYAQGVLASAGATGDKIQVVNTNVLDGWGAFLATVNAAGGGATTITVPAGDLVFKGPQAATAVDRRPGAGSLSWMGLAAAVLLSVAVPQGAIAYTGQTPSIIDHTANMGVGHVAWTGLVPTVVTDTPPVIAMPAGHEAYTGFAPTVRQATDIVFLPGAGSLVFKGPASPGSAIFTPDVGRELYTGQVPQAIINTPGSVVVVPAGTLTWQGRVPDRISSQTILVGAGSIVYAGQYVSVAFKVPDAGSLVWQGLTPVAVVNSQGTIAVPKGTLTYTGTVSVVRLDQGPAMPAGHLVFSSQAPIVRATYTIDVPAGSISYVGRTPESQRVIYVLPGAGTLLYNSQFVTPHLDTVYVPGAGSLVFTGQVPVSSISVGDSTIAVGAGSLLFTGAAPTPVVTQEIDPGAGSLLWTGHAPVLNVGLAPAVGVGRLVFTGQVPISQVLSPFVFPAGRVVWHGEQPRVVNSGVTGGGSSMDGYTYRYLYLYR